ncbi:outer membrane protein OmpA-like peptidoglycan-associated protein [Actinomycetospora cinnamomea]|uniref:Outer membrane protein OmpA-like peptidoglycan-associated protein n=1 Tax=Actinomycetospora cinnamomea TaxID=663609 RepID=A0A2U1F155_9PSEU|nr:outer membrane protein OmpA-like peptidoglycan-associated protein [Actinomycetospora cinnamomea]
MRHDLGEEVARAVTGGGGGLHRGRVTGRPGGARWWGGTGPAGGGSHAARAGGRRGVLALVTLLAVLAAGGVVAALALGGEEPAPPTAAAPPSPRPDAAPGAAGETGTTDPRVLQQTLDEVTAEAPLRFAPDTATPTPEAAAAVDRLAAALRASPGPTVTVEGHTAPVGEGGQRAVALSEDRAAEIARRLEAAGVPPARLRVIGVGSARPLASLEESRRVELDVTPS